MEGAYSGAGAEAFSPASSSASSSSSRKISSSCSLLRLPRPACASADGEDSARGCASGGGGGLGRWGENLAGAALRAVRRAEWEGGAGAGLGGRERRTPVTVAALKWGLVAVQCSGPRAAIGRVGGGGGGGRLGGGVSGPSCRPHISPAARTCAYTHRNRGRRRHGPDRMRVAAEEEGDVVDQVRGERDDDR
jgi:hypothetical protein